MVILNKTVVMGIILLIGLLNFDVSMAQPPVALFLDVGNIHPKDSLPPAIATLRTRYVRLNKALLFDVHGNIKNLPLHTEILFNLFPDVNLIGHITDKTVRVSEWEENKQGIAEWTGNMRGVAEWTGNIKGIDKGHFAIMLHNTYLPFQAHTSIHSYYIVEIGHDNLYRVSEIDERVLRERGMVEEIETRNIRLAYYLDRR
jgi:hypothetical protein